MTKRVLSIASVVLAVSVSCYATGLYLGFLNGKDLCGYQYPIIGSIGWVSDLDPYYDYFGRQRLATLFLFSFLVMSFRAQSILFQSIRTFCLLPPMILIGLTLSDKLFGSFRTDPYLSLAQQMTGFEVVEFALLSFAIILELNLVIAAGRSHEVRR